MNDGPVPPAVRDDPWELIEEFDETIGSRGPVTIRSERLLYGDHVLRDRVREATGIEREWRSFFVSRLTTSPAVPPGRGDLVVRTIALPLARSRFAGDLRERGFESVSAEETTRLTVAGDHRARLVRFSAAIPVGDAGDGPGGVATEAMLAVWAREDDMLVAGGTYPVGRLRGEDGDPVFAPPGEYREALLALVRAVG